MRFFANSHLLIRIFAHSCIRFGASTFVLQLLSLQIAFSCSFLFSSLQILLYRKIVCLSGNHDTKYYSAHVYYRSIEAIIIIITIKFVLISTILLTRTHQRGHSQYQEILCRLSSQLHHRKIVISIHSYHIHFAMNPNGILLQKKL